MLGCPSTRLKDQQVSQPGTVFRCHIGARQHTRQLAETAGTDRFERGEGACFSSERQQMQREIAHDFAAVIDHRTALAQVEESTAFGTEESCGLVVKLRCFVRGVTDILRQLA